MNNKIKKRNKVWDIYEEYYQESNIIDAEARTAMSKIQRKNKYDLVRAARQKQRKFKGVMITLNLNQVKQIPA